MGGCVAVAKINDRSAEDRDSDEHDVEGHHSRNQSILASVMRDRAKNKHNGYSEDAPKSPAAAKTDKKRNRRTGSTSSDAKAEKVNPTVQNVKSNSIKSTPSDGGKGGSSTTKPRTQMSINGNATSPTPRPAPANPAPAAAKGPAHMYPANMSNANPFFLQQQATAAPPVAPPANPNMMPSNNGLPYNAQQGSIPRQRGAPNAFAMSAPQGSGPAQAQGSVPRQRGAAPYAPPPPPPQGVTPFQPRYPQQHQALAQSTSNQWNANGNHPQANYNGAPSAPAGHSSVPRTQRAGTAQPPKPAEGILNKTTSFKVARRRKTTTDQELSANEEDDTGKRPKKMKLKGWFKRNKSAQVSEDDDEEEDHPLPMVAAGDATNLTHSASANKNDSYEYDAISVRSDDQFLNGGFLDSFVQSRSGTAVNVPFNTNTNNNNNNNNNSGVHDTAAAPMDLYAHQSMGDSMFSFKGLQDPTTPHNATQMYGNGSSAQRENELVLERALDEMEGKSSPKRSSRMRGRRGSSGGSQHSSEAAK